MATVAMGSDSCTSDRPYRRATSSSNGTANDRATHSAASC